LNATQQNLKTEKKHMHACKYMDVGYLVSNIYMLYLASPLGSYIIKRYWYAGYAGDGDASADRYIIRGPDANNEGIGVGDWTGGVDGGGGGCGGDIGGNENSSSSISETARTYNGIWLPMCGSDLT
jgi:hypothetical protein